MKLKELKTWINSLPSELLDGNVVFREYGKLEVNNHNYALDKPIVTCFVDEDNNEICLLDEKSSIELDKIEKENVVR